MKDRLTIQFLPFETVVQVGAGTSLLDAILEAGLPLKSGCGGKGTCGDCLVRITGGEYRTRPSAALRGGLSSQGYNLACQTEVLGDLVVELPQFEELLLPRAPDLTLFPLKKRRISGAFEVDPGIKKFMLTVPAATLKDNSSDLKRLEAELKNRGGIEAAGCEYSVLRKLARAVREEQGRVTVILVRTGEGWTIIDIEAGWPEKRICGLACDVGTTTVSSFLVDCESGEILAAASGFNRQLKCGEDIISRINYAQRPDRLQELQKLVIATVNTLVKKILESTGFGAEDVYLASISGNTTMIHLLLGLEPRYIREEPYTPTVSHVPVTPARELGIEMNPEGRVLFAPAVGSYVGGDITAGLLATPVLRSSKKISLFIDAGTNGELVVGNKEWLVTCACSAGPAFEGSGTKCGLPAVTGAIEKIRFQDDGELSYEVIGGGAPKGLCGSGLVDLLAGLFVHGYINRQGKFNEQKAGDRIWRNGRDIGFVVEEAGKSYWGKDIIITEKDIANLIRTKGAVFSACALLLKNIGSEFEAIDSIFIAGGFGNRLDIENAVRIGLLPDIARTRFHYLGNTSLRGASLLLLSEKNRKLVKAIARKVTYIELNAEPGYMNEYTGSLFLPHTDINLFPSVKKVIESWGQTG
jgi:uncharacterized 2Fe-2S/4Fe-4S cluster protein (DUF4445 family)